MKLRMLPTHPVEGKRLAVKIEVDGNESDIIAYQTQGRSEEWKENVLNNQAVRKLKMPVSRKHDNRLTITALDEGVVLDQIMVYGNQAS